MATERVILSGFGGQGVMSAGQLLTYAGMIENKEVSWLPSYGPEMRGGAANCSVVVSSEPVGSPVITNDATAAIVMNLPSLKFAKNVIKDGVVIVNSSLVDEKVTRDDVRTFYVPANEIAAEMGNSRVVNMVMLGAYLEISKAVEVESVLEAFKKVYGPSKEKLVPLNKEALERGAAAVR